MFNELKMLHLWAKVKFGTFLNEEKGAGEIIAVVIIIGIVILLGVAFSENISQLFGTLWNTVTGNQSNIEGHFETK